MKPLLLIGTLSIAAFSRAAVCPPGVWTPVSPVPGIAYRYGFAQNQDTFYVVAPGAHLRYDALGDLWTTLAPMPRPLQIPGVAYLDGKLYAAGGHDDGLTNELCVYDVATNTWSAGPAMPIWSYGSAAGAYAGKLFVVTGTLGQSLVIYDVATGSWSIGPSPPVAYRLGGHTQVGQFLYLIGGLVSGTTVSRRLDMATLTWSTGPVWTPGRGDFALASDGAKLYAMGGRVGSESALSREVYELVLANWPGGSWTRRAPDLPSPREANQAGFTSAGRVFSTGGYGAGATYTSEHIFFQPNAVDADGDGSGSACECDDGNAAIWTTPGEVHGLRLSKAGSVTSLQWDSVADSGAQTVEYDTLRSEAAEDFGSEAAVCFESGANLFATDPSLPLENEVHFFLIRARNACPGLSGIGGAGTHSSGIARNARLCP